MKKLGKLYRLGEWTVKPDKIPQFIEAWQAGVDWIAQNLPDGGEGILLQDKENPNKFISLAFSSNPEKTQEAMSRPEFQELMSRTRSLCEDVQPHRMQAVGYSSSSRDE
ncbi:MAG: antibiotic biosynthesis monooxygenase [Anaerolineae bacterium]|nr:antibiotic biosynthesis monooxygenase [Anaerolineae bacterium]